ncbi:MAG: hypothetical protein V4812_09325 [Pseudomonadota bacterium]
MRHLCLLLLAALLGACASQENRDPSGVWINQAAIDAAVQNGSLREALLAYGPVLEWELDMPRRLARLSNGFELAEGALTSNAEEQWRVDFEGDYQETLVLEDASLVQQASPTGPAQRFERSPVIPAANAPAGSHFEQALYTAYMSGTWTVREGPGQGGLVRFHPDGRVDGLSGVERYALCLAGDCASMNGEHDSLWLQQGDQGGPWVFVRDQEQLQIFEARNRAAIDEIPDYAPGPLRWLLEQD